MTTKKVCRGRTSSRCFSFKSKRGQITIFIIIGIVILFVTAGILYFSKKVVKESITTEGAPVIASVPQEFEPMKNFVDGCLEREGMRGLQILGQQGGYIYPDVVGKYSATNPTDSDGVDLEPIKVPYWHYNSQANADSKIVIASLKPKLYAKEDSEMSIEAQLSRFVKEKIDGCLNNFESFGSEGFSVQGIDKDHDVQVTVKVGVDKVGFHLIMPFKAMKGEAQNDFEQFYIAIPLDLKKYFDVASEITATEFNHSFLERQALDLIATYSAVDSEKLPPMEASTFEAVPSVYWTEVDVKEKLRGLLASKVPLLRYLGGENFYRFDYPTQNTELVNLRDLHQKMYDDTILPLDLGAGLDVNFDYFGWEPYFDANDKNGRIEPSNFGVSYSKLKFVTQHYYTTYDLSYPVIVTLRDPHALGNEGFNFVFALEANIRNNEIVKNDYIQPPPVAAVGKSMVCDTDKRNTQLVQTLVIDSYTKEPLSNVQIGFSVPNQDDCIMGESNVQGKFESAYPAVYGGVESLVKEEYLSNFYPVDTYDFKKQKGFIGYAVAGVPHSVIEMDKIKFINVSVKKKPLEKCIRDKKGNEQCFGQGVFGSSENAIYTDVPTMQDNEHAWVFVDAAVPLSSNESVTLILNRVGGPNSITTQEDFTATVTVKGDESTQMELVPGVYKVTGLMTTDAKMIIPKEERCDGSNCVTFDEQVFEKGLIGQIQWELPENYLVIRPDQFYTSNSMVFYIPSYDEMSVPSQAGFRVMEDLKLMGEMGNISQKLRINLEPQYK